MTLPPRTPATYFLECVGCERTTPHRRVLRNYMACRRCGKERWWGTRTVPEEVLWAADTAVPKQGDERRWSQGARWESALESRYQQALQQARRRMHLTEDEIWSSQCWNGGELPAGKTRQVEITAPPKRCLCGGRRLWYNGRSWYCDACHALLDWQREWVSFITVPDPPVRFSVLVEPVEEPEWAVAQRQAVARMNWPHGRIRPQARRANDGKPRRPRSY